MRNILQFSLILVTLFSLSVGIFGGHKISEPLSGKSDSEIYFSDDSTIEPVILHKGQYYNTISTHKPQPISPVNNGIVLDVPQNDDCANAQEISEVENLTVNAESATIDGGNFSTYPNIWFSYTASITGRIKVALEDTEYNSYGGVIAVYDGSTCPEYVDIPEAVEFQGGETIESAVAITDPLPVAYTGSLDDYDRDYTGCSCVSDYYSDGYDAVYSYTPTVDDSISIILTCLSSRYILLAIMDEGGNELACERWYSYINPDDNNGGPGINNFPVVAGETYYLVVLAYYYSTSGSYDYTLTIYSPDPDYTMIDRQYTDNCSANLIFDAISGHQYLIEVGYIIASSTTTLSALQAPDPPANDDCEYATDGGTLQPAVDIQFAGDNTGATIECEILSELPEVWLKFTTEETLDVKLDYCGTIWEVSLSWYSILLNDCPCNNGEFFTADDGDIMDCYDADVPYLWWYDLPPGTYYYPMVVHHDFEGEYVINVTAARPQYCSDSSLFGQDPSDANSSSWEFWPSDFETGYAVVDRFNGVVDAFNEVTWWGANADPESGESCDQESSFPFQIILLNYDDNSPYLPADTLVSYNVSATVEETGYKFDDIPQRKFVATLPESVEVEDGWIMIRGNDENSNGCAFYWQNSDLNGYGAIYDAVENSWTRTETSLTFCLSYDNQVGIDDENLTEIPATFELLRNYPNPFNAATSIQFSLDREDKVSLSVYDIGGRMIKSLYKGTLSAGLHEIIWDGSNESGEVVSSGIYFYRLNTSNSSLSKSMVLLK